MIAVGLVLISQGISGGLKALSKLQQYDRLLREGQSMLAALEVEAQHVQTLARCEGTSDEGSHWTLMAEPVSVTGILAEALHTVRLTLNRTDSPPLRVKFNTIWPASWAQACS